jgi:DNA-binding NarL/FixJ family response regulator
MSRSTLFGRSGNALGCMKAEALTHVLRARKVLKGNLCQRGVWQRLISKPFNPWKVEWVLLGPTRPQTEVLSYSDRLGTKGIASELHLSVKTIETHRAHIKEKLGFKDASEMVRFAIDWIAQEKG